MNYKDVLEFSSKTKEMELDISNSREYFETIVKIGGWLNEKSEEGMKIVLNRLTEEDFVTFVRAVKATLMTSMVIEGEGTTLLIAEAEGELDPFIHTIFLSLLGVLAEEEVI